VKRGLPRRNLGDARPICVVSKAGCFKELRVSIRSVLLATCALAFILLPAAKAEAQLDRLDGRPIKKVEYVGIQTLSEETLAHYLFGPARGERRLDLADLDARIKTMWKRELIDDIQVDAREDGDGVSLTIRVVERPVLVSVEYRGIKRVNRTDITERADKDRVSVFEGQPLQRGELERMKGAIEELYKEKGYRFAQVSYTLEDIGLGQKRAVFTIDEGDKVKIGDIDFDGNTVYGDWRLRLTMKKTKESGLISRISKKDIYNPANIEEDLDKVRELYKKAGYKDVLLGKPELDVKAKRPDAASIADQKRRLQVTIPVEEGERWKLGTIEVEGNNVFSTETLLAQFEKPRGGWLRSKTVDDGTENIKKLYSSIGFIFANVETEMIERENNVADIKIRIDESDQFRIGKIEFQGNTKTRDKVLRRELMVQEGLTMNMTGVQNSLLKIRQLNYFKLNEEEPVKFDFDAENKTVDLLIQGEEAERTELQFGGGWSEVDGFFGQFSLRTTNFLGRGETVGVSVQSGSQREYYDLEYRVPWFLDKPQSIGVRLFNQTYDSSILAGIDYKQVYSGASLTYGRSFRGFQSFSVTYSFADVDDRRVLENPDDPEDPFIQELNFKSSSIRPFWVRNTLDSRFEPTRGLSTTASLEVAGSVLGGETDYYRPMFNLTWFTLVSRQPFKSSFGINTEIGIIEPIGTDTREDPAIFPQQRFFLGGDSSVRGFRRRSIVVREEDGKIRLDEDQFPVGGDRQILVNAEYHIQVGGPFRMVFYADAGAVWAKDQSFDTDFFRYSAGAELRIKVPIFPAPLRFIYAVNLEEMTDDQFDSFDFSLSTTF
jgi:outer membrane protein insertion porin family